MVNSSLRGTFLNEPLFFLALVQLIRAVCPVCILSAENSFMNLALVEQSWEQAVKDIVEVPSPRVLPLVLPPGKCTKMETPFDRDTIYSIYNPRVELNPYETSRVLGPVYHDELDVLRIEGVYGAQPSELDMSFNVGHIYLGPGE